MNLEDYIEPYNKLLNILLSKNFDWFKKIKLSDVKYGEVRGQSFINPVGKIYVDSNWGYKQWKEYHYDTPFPIDEEISFGDMIGRSLSKEIQKQFKLAFSIMFGEFTPKYMSFSWIDVKFVDENENMLKEHIRKVLREEINLLFEAYTEEDLKSQYLDRGLVSTDEFFEVISMFKKPFYRNWLLRRMSEKVIPLKNIKTYQEYFKVFEKNKDRYPIKDLGLIKSEQDVRDFEETSKNLINSDIELGLNKESKNYVSYNDIKKLKSVGIELLGMTKNKFQVFMIPKSSNNNKTWTTYKNILGRCEGREEGKKIEFCTMANFDSFNEYLTKGDLFVLYNFSNQNSPYQFFYDGKNLEFRNNQNLLMMNETNICDIYNFLHRKNFLEKIDKYELPCMTDEDIKEIEKISNTKEKYHHYKKIIFDLLDDLFKKDLPNKEKEVIDLVNYKEYYIINKYLIHLLYEFLSKEYNATLYDIQTIAKIILEYYKSKVISGAMFATHNQGNLTIQERIMGANFFNGFGIKNFLTN